MKGFSALILIIVFLTAVFGLAGCRSGGELQVLDAWARPGIQGGNSAIYFVIDNSTGQDDVLLNASSEIAEHVELHATTMSDDGTMSMQHQPSVPAPANSKVEFQPGGLHIMLINLPEELEAGQTFSLMLQFQNAGEIQVDVEVRQP